MSTGTLLLATCACRWERAWLKAAGRGMGRGRRAHLDVAAPCCSRSLRLLIDKVLAVEKHGASDGALPFVPALPLTWPRLHLPQLSLVKDAIASALTAAEQRAHVEHPGRMRGHRSRTARPFAPHAEVEPASARRRPERQTRKTTKQPDLFWMRRDPPLLARPRRHHGGLGAVGAHGPG